MAAVLVETAEAIKDQLNAADLSLEIEAERSWADWDEKLTDSDTLHVDVVGITIQEIDLDDRTTLKYKVLTHIGVRKRFKQADQENTGRIAIEEVDALVLLVQEIAELFSPPASAAGRLTEFDSAVWEEFMPGMWFNRKMLRELSQFTAVVRVVHDVTRAI